METPKLRWIKYTSIFMLKKYYFKLFFKLNNASILQVV
jgi:hypothetical protein